MKLFYMPRSSCFAFLFLELLEAEKSNRMYKVFLFIYASSICNLVEMGYSIGFVLYRLEHSLVLVFISRAYTRYLCYLLCLHFMGYGIGWNGLACDTLLVPWIVFFSFVWEEMRNTLHLVREMLPREKSSRILKEKKIAKLEADEAGWI